MKLYMKKNVLLIVNPISGDIDKSDIVETVKFYAEENGYTFRLFETTGDQDEQKILQEYQKYQPERVLIAGGDGTVKQVAEALGDFNVKIGIIPAGSANGLSVDLDLPSNIEENLPIVFGNRFIAMDMISINNKLSIHLSDIGLNAQLVMNYENSSTRGMLGYALQAVSTLTNLEDPFEAVIETNNTIFKSEARMVVIANSKKYGTGVIINPNGNVSDGVFEIIILKNLDLLVLGKIITGNMPVESDDVEIISTKKAFITTNFPVNFQIDGEYIGKETRLNIHILPAKMNVAVK